MLFAVTGVCALYNAEVVLVDQCTASASLEECCIWGPVRERFVEFHAPTMTTREDDSWNLANVDSTERRDVEAGDCAGRAGASKGKDTSGVREYKIGYSCISGKISAM